MVAGAILVIAAVWIADANGVFVMSDNEVVDVRGSSLAWSMLGLGIAGAVAIRGGYRSLGPRTCTLLANPYGCAIMRA